MAFEITPISRWSLRPDEYYLPVPYGPDGRYNAIFYFKNQTDATLLQTLQTIFAPGGLVRIGNDYNPNSFPDVLVGNADGNILMADYDSVITLGKILAANFEIVGEDMDWVGHEMFEAFGEGWAGAPVLSHYGMTFTKMSKKETLLQIIDLAKLGWKIRVSRPQCPHKRIAQQWLTSCG
ncbi:hypothetical protein RRF57_002088 [Xylaria bambusicola]|uniref:Uncharacterized protein n=1 Tax=Xylaria bambusicola TaxID=326684 RepID=A0AAN7UE01_9PEZI